ncbi:hypothetical protein R84981_001100 [Carnimonas sp. R-84981]|uniref:MBL fold metallo-hydrolase n=1 Tax=Carnimonas bestiolae TaxID=3402172 RepID=UPI003EDC2EE0
MAGSTPLSWLTLKGLACAYRYRGPGSDHFDGKQFYNVPASHHLSRSDFKKWRKERKGNTPQWTWQSLPQSSWRPSAAPSADEIQVTFVNHSTFLLQFDGLNVLTDPVWSNRVSPFSFAGPKRFHAPGIALDELPRIDAIWLSHNHYDHCDVWALREIARRFPDVHLYTGLGNARLCKDAGISKVTELDWWQSADLGGRKLHFVPARHWGARSLWDKRRTLWGGFVFESSAGAVYFAGDTGFGEFFSEIGERYGPMTLSLLPIGAFRPEWFMHPVHMGPDEALQAHRMVQSKHSVACHFGCFALADDAQFEPQQQLEQAVASAGLDDESFRVPQAGRTVTYHQNQ